MKRIIFSIFQPEVVQDKRFSSVDDYKKNQMIKWHDKLVDLKNKYAQKCSADFEMIYTDLNDYTLIQFEKIRLLEKYAKSYDEVLYLDFDVIPSANANNIFDSVDTSKLCMHPLIRKLSFREMNDVLCREMPLIDPQTMFVKTCAKNAMLLLDGVNGNDICYNTGVVLGNKDIISKLNFSTQLEDMHALLEESKEDSVFPEEISQHFSFNNEVYISYLIERDSIPVYNLPVNWNFVLDDRDIASSTEKGMHFDFLHLISKNFDLWFK
jgi:hypothetical protein